MVRPGEQIVGGFHGYRLLGFIRTRERKIEPSSAIRQRLKTEITETGRRISHSSTRRNGTLQRSEMHLQHGLLNMNCCLCRELRVAIRMISLALDHGSLFTGCDPDAADFTPDSKIGAFVLDLCCFHGSSRFHWNSRPAFESAKRLQQCSPPDVCSCLPCTSKRASMRRRVAFLRRCGPAQIKWVDGTCGT